MRWLYSLGITGAFVAPIFALAYATPEFGFYLALAIVLATAIWAGIDCSHVKSRYKGFNENPFATFLGVFLVWIVVFPLYLARRFKLTLEPANDPRIDKLTRSECQICGARLSNWERMDGLCSPCQKRAG
jgi:hypothetical protein